MRTLWIMPVLAAIALSASCAATVQTESEPSAPAAAEQLQPAPEQPETATTEPPETTAAQPVETAATAPEAAQTQLAAVFADDGVAIAGADPVAYFTESAYVPGSDQFTYDWSGATWYFASAENRDQFASAPAQYAPQYGGFCAWAVSQGYTAPIDPTAWKIVEGKLYLNFDQNVQARWERDIPGNIAKADANWPEVADQ